MQAAGISLYGNRLTERIARAQGLQNAQQVSGLLPDAVAKPMMQKASVDRFDALYSAIDIMPLLANDDSLGVDSVATQTMPLGAATHAYDIFHNK